MSGHSKWSTIKRKKEKTDAAKGKIFTKIIREITIAAKEGGSNEENNPALKTAIAKAKSVNMPVDNINKAKLKGAGELPGVSYESVSYEGYGPGGVAVYVEVLTDNKQRSVSEVRHAFSKTGGNLGENGSVSWMFHKKGIIVLNAPNLDEDEVMEFAIESGAEDFKVEDDTFEITTAFEDFYTVKEAIESKFEIDNAEITMTADNYVKVPSDKVKNMIKLVDLLEDLDDVQAVYNNADFDEKDLEDLE